ncbi:MAG: arsenate reductase/protein-tyrosine-phosphatase family protein [Promethearchaeota archaeon]
MTKIEKILFLCSGNVCRSAFAEYYAKWLKNTSYKDKLRDVNFDSAGIRHYFESPHESTVRYLNSKGISIDGFFPKDITEELIDKQDLILAFEEKYHIRKLKRKFKNIENLDKKVFLLLEYAGETENVEIEDPFYLEENEYNQILKRIEDGIIKSIEKIIKINKSE